MNMIVILINDRLPNEAENQAWELTDMNKLSLMKEQSQSSDVHQDN